MQGKVTAESTRRQLTSISRVAFLVLYTLAPVYSGVQLLYAQPRTALCPMSPYPNVSLLSEDSSCDRELFGKALLACCSC